MQAHLDQLPPSSVGNLLWAYANLHAYHPSLFQVQVATLCLRGTRGNMLPCAVSECLCLCLRAIGLGRGRGRATMHLTT